MLFCSGLPVLDGFYISKSKRSSLVTRHHDHPRTLSAPVPGGLKNVLKSYKNRTDGIESLKTQPRYFQKEG
jgi:hypothetical protein